jgi:membrane associated rhomboid family serine protease
MVFFQEPRGRGEPFLRVPTVVVALIAVLAAIHVARLFLSPAADETLLVRLAFIPARYAARAGAIPLFDLALPFVGHIFLHASFGHLLANCLWLLVFGPVVARRYGASLFVLFFLLSGISGAATYLATNWGSPFPMIGASGGIAGLMGAGIRMLQPTSFLGLADDAPLIPIFSMRVMLFSVFWLVGNLLAGLAPILTGPGPEMIAWEAHMGGYALGLLLSGPLDAIHHGVARPAPPG